MAPELLRRFRRINAATLVVLLLLVFLGGIVRSTGAGMGCPDWPQCFGQWVPPTDVSQLPSDYQERYADHGYATMTFNAAKTWTEYVNRLFGALTGLFIIATLAASWPLRSAYPIFFRLCALNLLLVLFQGWLGSKVVSSNLADYMISIHFAMAFLIIAVAGATFWMVHKAEHPKAFEPGRQSSRLVKWGAAVLAITLIQVFLGTSVRASVNTAIKELGPEASGSWLSSIGMVYAVHKSWAYLTWAVTMMMGLQLIRRATQKGDRIIGVSMMLVVSLQALTGAAMAVWNFPAVPQAMHVMLATLLFSLQVSVILKHALPVPRIREAMPSPQTV